MGVLSLFGLAIAGDVALSSNTPASVKESQGELTPEQRERAAELALRQNGGDAASAGLSAEGEEEAGDPLGVEWFYAQREFPDGIPPGALSKARAEADALPLAELDGSVDAASAAPSPPAAGDDPTGPPQWYTIGPRPLGAFTHDFDSYTGQPPLAGRVTAIALHPTNANTAYLGSALGGVWKTTDGGANWVPIFDGSASLAIGSLAIAPSNPSVLYAGTGEGNSSTFVTSDSYYGTGVYKSTDAGATWQRINEPRFTGCSVAAMAVKPNDANVVLAGISASTGRVAGSTCDPGVYVSTNGGTSWTMELDTRPGTTEFPVQDLDVSGAAPGTFYASVTGDGVWKSVDSGVSWGKLGGGLPTQGVGRIEVTAPNAARLYAVVTAIPIPNVQDDDLLGVFTSPDAGVSWTQITSANFCRGQPDFPPQCSYDLAAVSPPSAPSVLYAGGVTMRKFTSTGLSSSPMLDPYLTNGVSGVHWDTHVLEIDASGRLWIGNDGGIYRSDDGGATAINLNATLTLSQFYPGISGFARGPLLGGLQDNASALYGGLLDWSLEGYGDGAGTGVDATTNPPTMYVTWYGMQMQRSFDGGQTWVDKGAGINAQDDQEFIWPLALGGGTPRRLYAGTNRVYRSTNRADSFSPISQTFPAAHSTDGRGDRVTAIAEAPSNGNVIYAGTHDGQLFVTTNGGQTFWTDTNVTTSPVPWRYVTDIAVHPTNSAEAYVTVSGFDGTGFGNVGHVFRTANSGTTWTNISGGGAGALPDTPTNAVLIDTSVNPARLFVGTDVGVFVSVDSGASWARFGLDLPNVVVVDLLLDAKLLVAATHGRGMYVVSTAGRPTIDAFASAQTLTGPTGSVAGTTDGATKQTGEPAHGGPTNAGGASIWYRWTPTQSGPVTVDTVGSGAGVDTLLSVYTGSSPAGLAVVAGNDDRPGVVGGPSEVSFNAVANTTYSIAVDGWNGGTGPFTGPTTLRWTQTPTSGGGGGGGGGGGAPPPVPAGTPYVALSPARVLETRPGLSTVDGAFGGAGVRSAGSITELQVTGRGGVPGDASAVVLNVTVTGAEGLGFITSYPCGESLPTASNLNFDTGSTIPNVVVAKIGAGGRVCLYTSNATHLIADVNGYFPP